MTSVAEIAPVVKEIVVNATVERAWEVFTAGVDGWWPVATHSVEPGRVREVAFENGRLFERWDDGTECRWGEVEVWEPPHRLRMAWQPNPGVVETTEVEVTFVAEGDHTRVRLEHRAWERLGPRATDARRSYDDGWTQVLGRYAERF